MTQLTKMINGTQYPLLYAYNLSGELSSMTYPSGRVVQENYDAIGRLCAVGSGGATCTTGTNYVSGFAYNTASQVTGFNYGNGVAATVTYSADRLQMQGLSYAKGAQTLASWSYWYKTDSTSCPNAPTGNDGQIQCVADNADSGRSVIYNYDALYRVASATTTGSTAYPKWGLSWSYDRYGNRTLQSVTAGSAPMNSVGIDATTNHINSSGYAYDTNGNMTNDGLNTLVYDAENRVVSTANGGSSGSYSYDGNGLRVKKVAGGSITVYIYSGSKVIAEYSTQGLQKEYVYAGSKLTAVVANALTNPGFESGNVNWNVASGWSIVNNSANAESGNWYLSGSGTTNVWGAVATLNGSTWIPVTPGQVLTYGGWIKRIAGTGVLDWDCLIVDSNHNGLAWCGFSGGVGDGSGGTNWQFYQGQVTVPSNGAYVMFYAEVHGWSDTDTTMTTGYFDSAFLNAGTQYYYLSDHLSNRLVTDASGNVTEQMGHYPFGESWYNPTNDKFLFTTYERDSESGNDFAMARYHVNRLGRFSSLDAVSGSASAPQSLNRYTYTGSDPINFSDPSGTVKIPAPDDPSWWTGGGYGGGGEGGLDAGDFWDPPPANVPDKPKAPPDRRGGGPRGGKMDASGFLAQALVALLNQRCAELFGGLANAVSSLLNSNYNLYAGGQQNPFPGKISSQSWSSAVGLFRGGSNAVTLSYPKKPGGFIFFSESFKSEDVGFGGYGQMTTFMHEQEHAANHYEALDRAIDSNYSLDHEKINERCKPAQLEQESSPITGGLTPP